MPDMEVDTINRFRWDSRTTFPAGTRIRVIVNDSTVAFDRTVPAGKEAKAQIVIRAELKDE